MHLALIFNERLFIHIPHVSMTFTKSFYPLLASPPFICDSGMMLENESCQLDFLFGEIGLNEKRDII